MADFFDFVNKAADPANKGELGKAAFACVKDLKSDDWQTLQKFFKDHDYEVGMEQCKTLINNKDRFVSGVQIPLMSGSY